MCVRVGACGPSVRGISLSISVYFNLFFFIDYYFPDVVSSKERDTAREETKSLMKSVL